MAGSRSTIGPGQVRAEPRRSKTHSPARLLLRRQLHRPDYPVGNPLSIQVCMRTHRVILVSGILLLAPGRGDKPEFPPPRPRHRHPPPPPPNPALPATRIRNAAPPPGPAAPA